jgi:hypothetical protein
MSNSLNHRKDHRSIEVFKDNILSFTQKEALWIKIYAEELKQTYSSIKVVDNGVDNSGELIEGNLKNHNADYIIMIDDVPHVVEVKTRPETSKTYTFKVASLRGYVEQNAAILVPHKELYYLFYKDALVHMLKSFPHKIYYNFSPNDVSVRLYQEDVDNYIATGIAVKKVWRIKLKR